MGVWGCARGIEDGSRRKDSVVEDSIVWKEKSSKASSILLIDSSSTDKEETFLPERIVHRKLWRCCL